MEMDLGSQSLEMQERVGPSAGKPVGSPWQLCWLLFAKWKKLMESFSSAGHWEHGSTLHTGDTGRTCLSLVFLAVPRGLTFAQCMG